MTKGRALKPRPTTSASTRRRTRHAGTQPRVNDQVDIWWDVDKTYYRGRLSKQLDHHMHFRIVYDDGDTEDINLHNEFWKFVHPLSQHSSHPPSTAAPEFDQLSLEQHNQPPHQQFTNNSATTPFPPLPTSKSNKRQTPQPDKPNPKQPSKSSTPNSVSNAPSASATQPTPTVNTAPPPEKTSLPQSPQPSETASLIDPAPLTHASVTRSQPCENPPLSRSTSKSSRPSLIKPKSHALNKSVASGKRRLSASPQTSNHTQHLTTPSVQQQPQPLHRHPSEEHVPTAPSPAEMTHHHNTVAPQHAVTQSSAPNPSTTRTGSPSHPAPTQPVENNPHKSSTLTPQKTKKRRLHSLRAEDNTHGSTQSSPPAASTVTSGPTSAQLRKVPCDETIREADIDAPTESHLAPNNSSLPIKVTLKRSSLHSSLSSTKQSVMNHRQDNGSHKPSAVRDPRLQAHKSIDKKRSNHVNHEIAPRGNGLSCATPSWNGVKATKLAASEDVENNATGAGAGASTVDSREKIDDQLRCHDTEKKELRINDDPNLDLVSPVSGHAERDTGFDALLGRKLAPIEQHMSKLTNELHGIRGRFDSTRQLMATTNKQNDSDSLKEIKNRLSALDKKMTTLCDQIGSVQEQLKVGLTDNQTIKRELAGVASFLRQEVRFRSQREQVIAGNTTRVPDAREPHRVQPTANGSANAARQVSAVPSRVNAYPGVHHYPNAPFPPPRNVVQFQPRAPPTGEVACEVRQPPTGEVVREARQPSTAMVQRNEANATTQQARYAVNYSESRNAQERFTYQVFDLVARQITVWLLETPHEHHKSGMALELWAKHTSSTAYARIAPRLAMYRGYAHASSTLSMSLNNNATELTWFIRPYEAGCTNRARRNYNAWDPPPTDDEWKSETVLLKELANGFHRTFQSYAHQEPTVLATSVALTRRTARDYEEAGYRPLLPNA